MKNTVILYDNPHDIKKAAQEIRKGKTVVFPTETVYGLGANGLSPQAVTKIYKAKGRPSDNPLILHISDLSWVNKLAIDIPQDFQTVAENFWPGPLTIVLKANLDLIPPEVNGGLDSVAIRIPGHPLALELLRLANLPIAAPSANTSGRPSPTSHDHVIEDLFGRVDYIFSSGETYLGIESTVLDMSRGKAKILRPGSITQEELQEVIDIEAYKEEKSGPLLSPGVKYRHYQPKAEMLVILGEEGKVREEIKKKAEMFIKTNKKVGILCFTKDVEFFENLQGEIIAMGSEEDLKEVANNLYKSLRAFDALGIDYILSRGILEPKGLGIAISNRLNKACGNNIYRI